MLKHQPTSQRFILPSSFLSYSNIHTSIYLLACLSGFLFWFYSLAPLEWFLWAVCLWLERKRAKLICMTFLFGWKRFCYCGIRIRIAYPMRLGVNIDFRLDIRLKLWKNRIWYGIIEYKLISAFEMKTFSTNNHNHINTEEYKSLFLITQNIS